MDIEWILLNISFNFYDSNDICLIDISFNEKNDWVFLGKSIHKQQIQNT